jgi:hypothetical protein
MPAKLPARKQFGAAIEKTIELGVDMGYSFPPSSRCGKWAGDAARTICLGYMSWSDN